MTKEDYIVAIKQIMKEHNLSKVLVDPVSRGSTLGKLLKGHGSLEKAKQFYESAKALYSKTAADVILNNTENNTENNIENNTTDNNNVILNNTTDNNNVILNNTTDNNNVILNNTTDNNKDNGMEKRIESLEKKIAELEAKNSELERAVKELKVEKEVKEERPKDLELSSKEKILGYTITFQKYIPNKGEPGRKWYAVNKKRRIYIGESYTKELAEKKIQAYCTKKGITTEVSTAGNLERY
jgi:hypothetical protein